MTGSAESTLTGNGNVALHLYSICTLVGNVFYYSFPTVQQKKIFSLPKFHTFCLRLVTELYVFTYALKEHFPPTAGIFIKNVLPDSPAGR
jgi:hypothetical protein